MNVLYVAYYTAIRYLRNIMCVLFFTVAPLLMIYATTSGGGMSYEKMENEFSEKIGYLAVDKGELARQFSSVMVSTSTGASIEFLDITSYEKGMEQLRNGDMDSFIYIDKAASDSFDKGEKAEIKVFITKSVSAAKTMVEGFVNNVNGIGTVLGMDVRPVLNIPTKNMDVTTIDTEGKMPSMQDAAILGNILLFLFYGALLGSYSILNDVVKNTTLRFRCAPIRYSENITGKTLGNLTIMSLSTAVMLLFSKYVLKVNWEGNMLTILAALFFFLLIINNVGVIIAGFTRNIYLCGLITFAVDFFLVYGVMVEAYAPGKGTTLDVGRIISPHYYVYEAITGSIYGSLGINVQHSLLVLAFGAIITTMISFTVGRRKIG